MFRAKRERGRSSGWSSHQNSRPRPEICPAESMRSLLLAVALYFRAPTGIWECTTRRWSWITWFRLGRSSHRQEDRRIPTRLRWAN